MLLQKTGWNVMFVADEFQDGRDFRVQALFQTNCWPRTTGLHNTAPCALICQFQRNEFLRGIAFSEATEANSSVYFRLDMRVMEEQCSRDPDFGLQRLRVEFRQSLNKRLIFQAETQMGRQAIIVLYIVLMVATVASMDFLFFRNRFWERLMVNIGIVLVFAAFYLRFLKRP